MTAVASLPAALPTTAASSVAPPSVEISKAEVAVDDNKPEKPHSSKQEIKEEAKEKSDEKDAKAGDTQSPTNPAETSTGEDRPRATSGARSLFDLEPNPFEQSFSRGSQSQPSERTTPPRGGDATSVKHNALPPLSSLTSPAAADPNQFPWLAGHSLRSGPLSPAMLAGPAQGSQQAQSNNNAPAANAAATWGATGAGNEANSAEQENFEPGNFRTGFTPGAGTGFTPGYNALLNSNFGGPLPMPSPNTAAFLNSITNVNENGGDQNGTAPPAGNVMDRPPPSAIPPHLQQQAHGPVAPPLNPGNAVADPNALNALGALATDMNRGPPPGPMQAQQQPYYPPGMHPGGPGLAPGMPPQVDYAQQNANAASQAANGLFLLSQAHQELSKREREEAQSSPLGKRGAAVPPKPIASGQKRKDPAPAKGATAKKNKKKDGTPSSEDDGEDKKVNRNETEEEKRRNFLERNRQAALKCRQRKKAWLNELQNKVETLSVDNERLQHTVRSLEDELQRLSTILMQHRDCGLAIPPAPMPSAYGRPLR